MKKSGIFLLMAALWIMGAQTVFGAETAVLSEYVTTVNLNLREAPTTESTRLNTFSKGTAVQVTDWLDYEWYAVTVEGMNGYMKAEFLTEKVLTVYADISVTAVVTDAEMEASLITPLAEGIPTSAEMLTWSEAKKIFTTGVPMQVIDVCTKISYWVSSFSNGNHADVEPVTTEDTAAMKRSYNGKWSWDTRPIWVIINGRTLAASISGMPHGGGVNNNNGMNGQVCIHFKDSRTHNGNKSHERDHQNTVAEAYESAR